jgi:hypothetical protein
LTRVDRTLTDGTETEKARQDAASSVKRNGTGGRSWSPEIARLSGISAHGTDRRDCVTENFCLIRARRTRKNFENRLRHPSFWPRFRFTRATLETKSISSLGFPKRSDGRGHESWPNPDATIEPKRSRTQSKDYAR